MAAKKSRGASEESANNLNLAASTIGELYKSKYGWNLSNLVASLRCANHRRSGTKKATL